MRRKRNYIILIVLTVVLCLMQGCGRSDDKLTDSKENNDNIDMSVYKGVGGYIIENNTFDYRKIFSETYEWTDNVHMPFPKMNEKNVIIEDTTGYCYFDNVTRQESDAYINSLEQYGYSIHSYDGNAEISEIKAEYLIYNEKMHVVFYLNSKGEFSLYVYTGFVTASKVSVQTVRNLIDENGLLKDNAKYEKYYVLPIGNDALKNEGLYQFIVMPEKYLEYSVYPYYLLTDGENILLFEENVWDIHYPATVALNKTNTGNELIITSTIFPSDANNGYTQIMKYLIKDGKIEQKSDKRIECDIFNGEIRIGILENGEYKLYETKTNQSGLTEGRKDLYKRDKEYDTKNN